MDLGSEPAFALGAADVAPAACAVSWEGETLRLQPRTMQVLVALAQAGGEIVSREALVARCWAGQVVGDDALNRVAGQLRRLAEQLDGRAFELRTIPRVGYQLVPADRPELDDLPPPETMPEPAVRRGWRVPLIAAALLLALTLAYFAWPTTGDTRPVVIVDLFTPTGPDIEPSLPTELRSEVVDFLANEKYYAVAIAPGAQPERRTWRLRGTIVPQQGGRQMVVFADLFRPGSEAAITQLRIERDADQPLLARSLGLRIGRTAGCVLLGATNEEITGGNAEAALPTLAASCITWHDKTTSLALRIDRFRDNAAALPRSAYFRARVAQMLGDQAANGAPDAARLRAEGQRYVADAERIDPGEPHILLAKARLLPVTDFAAREALFQRALRGRPSDCACEFGDYSLFLNMVGRHKDARVYADRATEKEPKNIPWLRRSGEAAALAGDNAAAHRILKRVADFLPEPGNLDEWRLNLALWSRDWSLAREMAGRQPDAGLRSAQLALIDALASGQAPPAGVGQAFAARAADPEKNDRAAATGLAAAERPDAALAAAARLIARRPSNLSLLFEPSFAAARETPQFAALVTRVGLTGYWRASGNLPDFCLAADAPALCAGLQARPDRASAP